MTWSSASFFSSMTTRMPRRSDSSRRSADPVDASRRAPGRRSSRSSTPCSPCTGSRSTTIARWLAAAGFLERRRFARTGEQAAAAAVGLSGSRSSPQDRGARGEVRARHASRSARRGSASGLRATWTSASTDLAQVVRRDVRGHADGDAGRAVDQQVGDARRQHDRLGARVVVVRDEVDGVAVDDPRASPTRSATDAPRCSAWLQAGRRRSSRSCPGRRPAGSAARTAGRDAPPTGRSTALAVRVVVARDVAGDLGALPVGAVRRSGSGR